MALPAQVGCGPNQCVSGLAAAPKLVRRRTPFVSNFSSRNSDNVVGEPIRELFNVLPAGVNPQSHRPSPPPAMKIAGPLMSIG